MSVFFSGHQRDVAQAVSTAVGLSRNAEAPQKKRAAPADKQQNTFKSFREQEQQWPLSLGAKLLLFLSVSNAWYRR